MLFAYDLNHWLTFLTAATLLNLAPGPDVGFILAHTVRGGRAAGFAAMVGIWTGALGHVLFAAVGLSAIIVASAEAYAVVKYAGAAYLLWLGFQALRSKGGLSVETVQAGAPPLRKVFAQGVFIDLLNPKVAIFFLAFLPQFVEPGAGAVPMQLMLHGLLIIAVAACIEPFFVLAGSGLTRRLRSNRRFGLWMDRTLGGFFAYLGLRLALSER